MKAQAGRSGAGDFDFFIGHWRVQHRRLNERLAGGTTWTEFEGRCQTQKVLGGLGNLDDNFIGLPSGAYRAVTLRTYDPETRQWTIWWLDGRYPGSLDKPVVGAFKKGVGMFHADDELKGRPIKIRFLWSIPAKDKPRWEQSFSADDGKNWETNWIMNFTRDAT